LKIIQLVIVDQAILSVRSFLKLDAIAVDRALATLSK